MYLLLTGELALIVFAILVWNIIFYGFAPNT